MRPGRWPRGKTEHRLRVADVDGKPLGQGAEEPIVPGRGVDADLDRAELPAARVPAHLAAQRVGDQLMPIADPQKRDGRIKDRGNPASHALAPRLLIGHHAVRAGQHQAGELLGIGQAGFLMRVEHGNLVGGKTKTASNPVVEIATCCR